MGMRPLDTGATGGNGNYGGLRPRPTNRTLHLCTLYALAVDDLAAD